MNTRELLQDAFERIRNGAQSAVDGLSLDEIAKRPDDEANTIAWLVWHLARVQDHHVSELADRPQAWVTGGWSDRFGTSPDPENTGFGHGPDDVAGVRPESIESLLAYQADVHDLIVAYLETIDEAELDRIVDRRWDPPVTAGVRLVSVINDAMQHVGQANYLKGLIERGL